MRFKITQIEFDDVENVLNSTERFVLYDEICRNIWQANHSQDLIRVITDAYGWNVKNIQCHPCDS